MRFIHWMTLLTTVAVGVALIVLVIQGRQAQATRNEGLRTFICYFQSAVLKSPHQTPAEREKAVRFFGGVLDKLHEPPCSTL